MSLLNHVVTVHGGELKISLTELEIMEQLLVADIKFMYCFWSLFKILFRSFNPHQTCLMSVLYICCIVLSTSITLSLIFVPFAPYGMGIRNYYASFFMYTSKGMHIPEPNQLAGNLLSAR